MQVLTTLGPLYFDLYCHLAPKTCENFLELCNKKYYKGTKFHRLIKGFMIQGGDPSGTGKSGQSYFGRKFEDEISDKMLKHSQRGMLSMANSGPNTNGSQFFITFKKAEHLDRRHTVFGKLVKGFGTLDQMEEQKVGDKDEDKHRPAASIEIIDTIVLHNPFRQAIAELLKQDWKVHHQNRNEELARKR